MQLPIVAHAPIVTAHADVFRDLFANRCKSRYFQNYVTELIVLDNKSLADMARSRIVSEAPWFQDCVNNRRLQNLLEQTKAVHRPRGDLVLVLDDA